jgi:trehalose synthase
MLEVPIAARPDHGFSELVHGDDLARYRRLVDEAAVRFRGRTLWHVNSTAVGGGVAEILASVLGYLVHGGIDTRWLVMEGDPSFFDVTKRIHNRLHGELGDGGRLDDYERQHYVRVTEDNLEAVRGYVRPGDVVIVHDPQPLGLVPGLTSHGAVVIWTCHVGVDEPNDIASSAWDFLRPYLDGARAFSFTRRAYVWDDIDLERLVLIPPCIDAYSLKNIDLEPERREAILDAAGVMTSSLRGEPLFTKADGTETRVVNRADVVERAPVPAGAPLAVQVSRWDRLKDPVGVIAGFAGDAAIPDAHLLLAGPAPSAVADDPEALSVLDEVEDAWDQLRPDVRDRVHLVNLPTEDVEENAVIVNALQRRADVVVQKSLAEGFGLTVTEAMWKERPMVASRVGGIQDQIADGQHGRLVDPRDLTAFRNALDELLGDPEQAAAMGAAARERVRSAYLAPHYLANYLEMIERVDDE